MQRQQRLLLRIPATAATPSPHSSDSSDRGANMLRLITTLLFVDIVSAQQSAVPAIFYPFSVSSDSTAPVNDDGPSPSITLSQPFPYFDQNHQDLTVNTNGVISFLTRVSQYTPDSFPLDNNRRIIAGFWADVDTRKNNGRVYYRESTQTDMLARATTDVRRSFIRAVNFQATWVFIVTWYQVTFFGGSSTTPVNDFQIVLISDGRVSYAMFNYGSITWTTGRASNGNSSGLGGTPAQVGFNAGDGLRFFNVPGSQTSAIVDVETTTNVGITGRWMFQVDEYNVVIGSLSMQPRYSTLLGGTLVTVSGPSFDGVTDFVCQIGNKQVSGVVIDGVSAAVVAPESQQLGLQRMSCSVDGGRNFTHNSFFRYIEFDGNSMATVIPAKTDYSRPPGEDNPVQPGIIEWTPTNLPPNTDRVNVEFHEISDNGQQLPPIILLEDIENDGRVDLPTTLQHPGIGEKSSGTIRITPTPRRNTNPLSRLVPFITSPFLWLPAHIGPRIITSFVACKAWAAGEEANPPDFNEVIPSPCNLAQARQDNRFSPDPMCDSNQLYSILTCPLFHSGAHHCVRSTRPGRNGGAQQACYNKAGDILDFENGGGTYDRSSSAVSAMKHFINDVLPHNFCCTFKFLNLCPTYKKWRPTHNCAGYEEPPPPARTIGDPHATTFDGFRYTFNGLGEFILAKLGNISIQGRAQPLAGISRATVWTAIVIGRPGLKAEIRINSRLGLEVLVNGNIETFTDLTQQTFGELHVTSVVPDKHVTLHMTYSGVKLDIREVERTLSITISLSNQWKGRPNGLLGNMNGRTNDDLQLRSGTTLSSSASESQIYTSFGLSWRLQEVESLFTYVIGTSYQSINAQNGYVPQFGLPSVDVATAAEGRRICGENRECLFDFYITKNAAIAAETMDSDQRLNETIFAIRTPIMCPMLSSNSVSVNSSSRTVGTVVRLSCSEHYHLVESGGPKVCHPNASWTGKDIVCQKKCPFLSSSAVSVSSSDRIPGAIVHVSCADGYKTFQPAGPRECLVGGNWNLPNIECSRISTGSAGHIQPSFFLATSGAFFLKSLKAAAGF